MGACTSATPTIQSKVIDKQLKRESKKMSKRYKLILLGSAGVGKSTIFKQMNLLYGAGFLNEDRITMRHTIYRTIFTGLKLLVEASKGKNFKTSKIMKALTYMEATNTMNISRLTKIWKLVSRTWAKSENHSEYCNLPYFIERLPEIAKKDYVPTDADMLRARAATTGIVEKTIDFDKKHFNIVDIGGHRSERRKWQFIFADVDIVVYVIDLVTEHKQKGGSESLLVFSKLLEVASLENSHWVLFMNKVDIFMDQFEDEKQANKACKNIEKAYRGVFKDPSKLYSFVTCAIDTKYIEKVMNSMKTRVLVSGLTAIM